MIDKIIYTGIFLDVSDKRCRELKARFSESYDVGYLHHLTLEFRPTDVSNVPFGKQVTLKVIGQIEAEGVQAFVVDRDSLGVWCANEVPHITVAVKQGTSPAHTNVVLRDYGFVEKPEFYIQGRVGAALTSGEVVYEF